jgi:chaperonin cofactor prefoldin
MEAIDMGLFWDLVQQSQISKQRDKSESLEMRVRILEREVERQHELLHALLVRLEERTGEDIDSDGKIG